MVGGANYDYPDLQSAIKYLNTFGVGNGGVTFKIRTGTYIGTYMVSAMGTASTPIVFEPDSGAQVVLQDNPSMSGILFTLYGPHVTIRGLHIKTTNLYGLIEIRSKAKNSNISGNTFISKGAGFTCRIAAPGTVFENNTVSHNGNGDVILDNIGSTILGNKITVEDGRSNGIRVMYWTSPYGTGAVIDGNDIRLKNISPNFWQWPAGIDVYNPTTSRRTEITNNVIAGFIYQIYMWKKKTGPRSAFILNNTLIAPAGQISGSWGGYDLGRGSVWENNLFYHPGSGLNSMDAALVAPMVPASNSPASVDGYIKNNIFYVPNGAYAYPNFSKIQGFNWKADPEFVDLTPGQEDYRLKSTSPCIDAGATTHAPAQGQAPVPFLVVDMDGNSRPQGRANDIGAFEYVASAPSPLPIPIPVVVVKEEAGSSGCAGSIASESPSPLYFFFGMALLLGLSVKRRI